MARRSRRQLFTPLKRLKLSDWAEQNRVLSSATASAPGPFRLDYVPYMREIMDAISDPRVREVVILKSARLGLTEAVINTYVGYIIDQEPGPILVVWPTKDDAQDWSKETLPDLFETTSCLQGKVPEATARDSNNTILHKRFHGGFLFAVGSNSPRTLRRKNAKYVLIDEYDACDQYSKGREGDVGARAIRRADTFNDRKIIKTGSPDLAETSKITRDYLKTDQRVLELPCPHCGAFQELVWKNFQWDKVVVLRRRVAEPGARVPGCTGRRRTAAGLRRHATRRGVLRPRHECRSETAHRAAGAISGRGARRRRHPDGRRRRPR